MMLVLIITAKIVVVLVEDGVVVVVDGVVVVVAVLVVAQDVKSRFCCDHKSLMALLISSFQLLQYRNDLSD